MAIRIVPHESRWTDAVHAFNLRMREGRSPWGFYPHPECEWLPRRPDSTVWREFHLAVEDDQLVRGGYALKPQRWLIRGSAETVTDWQGPFSEGAYDAKFAALGLRMVRDMLKKRPLLYSWGHGGEEEPLVQMLRKMGWLMHETPLCVRVARPFRFLREARYLRRSRSRRVALDAAAFTGLGSAGVRVLALATRLRNPGRIDGIADIVEEFGPWADEVWAACKDDYLAIAIRDSATMNTLLPRVGWPPVIRLAVRVDDRIAGWAVVMDTAMKDDRRFGDLRVGSIVDCLARPADAGAVVGAAWRFLRARGVDVVVSNQADPRWIRGFAQNGFAVVPRKRIFAASPELAQKVGDMGEAANALHLTNLDGHGPMAL